MRPQSGRCTKLEEAKAYHDVVLAWVGPALRVDSWQRAAPRMPRQTATCIRCQDGNSLHAALAEQSHLRERSSD